MTDPTDRPVDDGTPLADRRADPKLVSSEVMLRGLIWNVVRDEVELDNGTVIVREYLRHPGAVGILALDDDDRVAFVRQYRHPVGYELWELPAGLLDVDGEPPVRCAQRELAEEADLYAGRWDTLIDWFNSPGGVDEAIRVFLARDLRPVPEPERHERAEEEALMVSRWVSLDEAHAAVLAGRLNNPTAVVGVLAAHAARAAGWTTLRPADAPWPEHKAYR
jgi:ADP-ribose pyrophosphatase